MTQKKPRNYFWHAAIAVFTLTVTCISEIALASETQPLTSPGETTSKTQNATQIQKTNAVPKPTWHGFVNLGLTLYSGYRDACISSVSVSATHKRAVDTIRLSVNGGYGEAKIRSETVTIAKHIRGGGSYEHPINQKLYVSMETQGESDYILGIDYRVVSSVSFGYKFISTTNLSLSAEVGPTLTIEKFQHGDDNVYPTIYLGERFDYVFPKGPRIWQRVAWIPDFQNWPDRQSLRSEVGVQTPLTSKFALRVVFEHSYENPTPRNRNAHEARLTTGLSYTF